ncbi:MAG: hypothetical protein JNM66_33820 [Bryobacterales bacterium]|nr:hypothetical protein [Bryobacterales bacterium]
MPYRFAASTTGPLAEIAGSLALPAALALTSQEPHHVWALVDSEKRASQENAWAILPATVAIAKERFQPVFDSIDDFLPGITVLMERRARYRATASAEVSALWTSLAAPVSSALKGDIGLDLDLGIQADAQWEAVSDCWWSMHRPTGAPVLRVRLCAARTNARTISVKAGASAGLDQATRNALAAIAGRHRTQLLTKLRDGAEHQLGKLSVAKEKARKFLDTWLALPAEVQAEQWRDPAEPLLARLKALIEDPVRDSIAAADPLTARLEYAAVRTLEKKVEASLAALFDKRKSNTSLLEADFDFGANPGLIDVLRQMQGGDLSPLLTGHTAGVTLHRCSLRDELTRRNTFAWRLPFASGFVSRSERLATAMDALDDETGRVLLGQARAESERHTRHASSLLSIEGAFAARLGPDVTVHDPACLRATFTLDIRTNRPSSLQPLLSLYGGGTVDKHATACRLDIALPPESIEHWLEPQDPVALSKRMQQAWRTLLPLAIDMDELSAQAAAPLLVWASLPVAAGARRTSKGLMLNLGDDLYWDWADPYLLEGMVWNPRTRAALDARLEQTHISAKADDLRRAVSKPAGAAVFASLLRTESMFIEKLAAHMGPAMQAGRNPVETMRNLSKMLAALASAFHSMLTSVYGPEPARALGPLLLCSATPHKPVVEVTWSR